MPLPSYIIVPYKVEECDNEAALPPTTSPYFARKTNPKKSIVKGEYSFSQKNSSSLARPKRKHATKGTTSSRHFTTSPSSAVRSVLSLGPFLSTLCWKQQHLDDNDRVAKQEENSELQPNSSEDKSQLDAAASHFQHCPIFAKMHHDAVSKMDTTSKSPSLSSDHQSGVGSNDIVLKKEEKYEAIMHHSVRHICPHGCYLRAYAAVREWHNLRTAVYELSGCSPDRVLTGWKCYLLPPHFDNRRKGSEGKNNLVHASIEDKINVENDENEGNQDSEQCFSHLSRIVFVAPNGEAFGSRNSVLRRLAMIDQKDKNIEQKDKSTLLSDFDLDRPVKRRKRRSASSIVVGDTLWIGSQQSIIEAEPLLDESAHSSSSHCKHALIGDNITNTQMQWHEQKILTHKPLKTDAATSMQRISNTIAFCPQGQIKTETTASPFGLLEEIFETDPWRLLLSTILLNKTSRSQVDPNLLAFFLLCPDAKSAAKGDVEQISKVIAPLGLMHKRARAIVQFSKEYLELIDRKNEDAKNEERNQCDDKNLEMSKEHADHADVKEHALEQEFSFTSKDILSLYNCGQYSADAYEVFIHKRYNIPVSDYALKMYTDYQRGCRKILSSMDKNYC